jgi:ribosome biogenesis GTPase / thiamine phosphate phosphatase
VTKLSEESEQSDGIVVRAGRGLYTVQTDSGRVYPCRLRGNLKKSLTYAESNNLARRVERVRKLRETDPIAVGDRVTIAISESGREGMIEAIAPRHTALTRRSGNEHERQTLIANLDQVFIVFAAADPRPDLYQLDRFLVLAEDAEVAIQIIFNKADLVDSSELSQLAALYEVIGYTVRQTCAKSNFGIDALRLALKNRISAFCGPSGAGKSSLLNAIQPGLKLKTGEIGEVTHTGRHTTVAAELLPLDIGGWVADTPGLRQIEFWKLPTEDIGFCFPEIAPLMGRCKFTNCRHRTEPGCMVLAAQKSGALSERRYQSYLQMS